MASAQEEQLTKVRELWWQERLRQAELRAETNAGALRIAKYDLLVQWWGVADAHIMTLDRLMGMTPFPADDHEARWNGDALNRRERFVNDLAQGRTGGTGDELDGVSWAMLFRHAHRNDDVGRKAYRLLCRLADMVDQRGPVGDDDLPF